MLVRSGLIQMESARTEMGQSLKSQMTGSGSDISTDLHVHYETHEV